MAAATAASRRRCSKAKRHRYPVSSRSRAAAAASRRHSTQDSAAAATHGQPFERVDGHQAKPMLDGDARCLVPSVLVLGRRGLDRGSHRTSERRLERLVRTASTAIDASPASIASRQRSSRM